MKSTAKFAVQYNLKKMAKNFTPVPDYQMNAQNCENRIDSYCALDIDSKPINQRLSGIVCTIGPASRDITKLIELMKSGMTIARMNFSHGTHDYHLSTIQNVRRAAAQLAEEMGLKEYPIGIALDTKGPEIRTGLLETKGDVSEVELIKGKTIKITTNDDFKEKCSPEILYVDYKNITKVLVKDSRIYVDDGLISLRVQEISGDSVLCQIENGGMLGSKKGVNLPGAIVDLPAVSEKDRQDLIFGCQNNVDMIFASFIRNGNGVKEIRNILNQHGNGQDIKIISKVENHEGVKKIDEIIKESDGIMVARGDMGIEIPAEKVFVAQKMIITKCNLVGKPVICATQMLESMTKKPRPTRAEVSDVANAILDGSDCVMLSGETAKGDYPEETVKMMNAIVLEAETMLFNKLVYQELANKVPMPCDSETSMAMGVAQAASKFNASVIVAATSSNRSGHLISKFRPRCPILWVLTNSVVARQSNLYRGIMPLKHEPTNNPETLINDGINHASSIGLINSGDNIVTVIGEPSGFKIGIRQFQKN